MVKRFCICILLLLVFMTGSTGAQDNINTEGLESLLDEFVEQGDPGVVLFVSVGDASWVGARGLANLDTGELIKTTGLFRIASITKPFVATLVLQLFDEGKLNLDVPIADFLPLEIVENVENAGSATVRQMLQMTSGIFDYTEGDEFNDMVEANPSYSWTAAETIETIYGLEAYFSPGEGYYYSNSNYNLAQIIVEAVTGDSLSVALETRIFAPVGMSSCYLETPDRFAQGIVRGYELDEYENAFVDVTEYNDGIGLGDGGIVCAAEDLAKFPRALLTGDLISEDALSEMFTTVEDDYGEQYGLGIAIEESEFGTTVWHDGATSGFQSNMVYLPDSDVTMVVLTNNFDSDIIYDLTIGAQALVLGAD